MLLLLGESSSAICGLKRRHPSWKENVVEICGDGKLPDDVNSIISISIQCSKTGEYFVQKDTQIIFMIPVLLVHF